MNAAFSACRGIDLSVLVGRPPLLPDMCRRTGSVEPMKHDYDPVTGTSPDDRPEDEAVYAWYGGERAQAGLTCPVCFAMVGAQIVSARGHMEWHRLREP